MKESVWTLESEGEYFSKFTLYKQLYFLPHLLVFNLQMYSFGPKEVEDLYNPSLRKRVIEAIVFNRGWNNSIVEDGKTLTNWNRETTGKIISKLI